MIVPGDFVMAMNLQTGFPEPKKVTRIFDNFCSHRRILRILGTDGNVHDLATTDGHPLWVESRGWTLASDLKTGAKLLQPDGDIAVVVGSAREWCPFGIRVFNFEVDGLHNYFVCGELGTTFILVHNASFNDPYQNLMMKQYLAQLRLDRLKIAASRLETQNRLALIEWEQYAQQMAKIGAEAGRILKGLSPLNN